MLATRVGSIRIRVMDVSNFITVFKLFDIREADVSVIPLRIFE